MSEKTWSNDIKREVNLTIRGSLISYLEYSFRGGLTFIRGYSQRILSSTLHVYKSPISLSLSLSMLTDIYIYI